MKKLVKINILMISFVFLTGFVPIVSWFAPVATIFSSGNVYKAGLQLLVDQGIQKKTGKNCQIFPTCDTKNQHFQQIFTYPARHNY